MLAVVRAGALTSNCGTGAGGGKTSLMLHRVTKAATALACSLVLVVVPALALTLLALLVELLAMLLSGVLLG